MSILKIGLCYFFSLSIPFGVLIGQEGASLDRFEEIYSQWANEHPEYECELKPQLEVVNFTLHLWQIKKAPCEFDSIYRINSTVPISYEAYIFMTDEGDQVMNFPETHRTILLYPQRETGSVSGMLATGMVDLSSKWSFMKPFLIFESLNEEEDSVLFEMILDIKKMGDAGVIPVSTGVSKLRMIFSLAKDGKISRISRQFDDDALDVLCFDYISFSSEEIRNSFPDIDSRSSGSITPGWSIKDAIDEIIAARGGDS